MISIASSSPPSRRIHFVIALAGKCRARNCPPSRRWKFKSSTMQILLRFYSSTAMHPVCQLFRMISHPLILVVHGSREVESGSAKKGMSMAFGWADQFEGSATELTIDVSKLIIIPHGPMMVLLILVLRGRWSLHLVNTPLSIALVVILLIAFSTDSSPIRLYEGHDFANCHPGICQRVSLNACLSVASLVASSRPTPNPSVVSLPQDRSPA